MPEKGVTYKLIRPGVIQIKDDGETVVMTVEGLTKAIKSITAARLSYETELAYQRALAKYTGALAWLDATN